MDRLELTSERICKAIERGAAAEQLPIATSTEPFGGTDMLSVMVFGDGIEALSAGQRYVKVMGWIKQFDPDVHPKVATLLVLTHKEAGDITHQTPASGTIMELGEMFLGSGD
jgi:hypothetical protein